MDIQLHTNHQSIVDKFIKACQSDERIIATFLVGSYVKGMPDDYSDLDLFLVTTDDSFDDFVLKRDAFIRLLGEPLFVEDFDNPNIVFLIFPDGTEVEINYVRESQAGKVFNMPFKVLLDKKNISERIVPEVYEPDQSGQIEKLRRLVYWFWHDFSHFVTAMGRGQMWWAKGQLEVLRSICASLARLEKDFSDTDVGGETYFKIEKAVPVDALSPLLGTFCPMEKKEMIKAGFILAQFYREHAKSLAHETGIVYPERLDHMMVEKLKNLQ